jgi:hypothetical protein
VEFGGDDLYNIPVYRAAARAGSWSQFAPEFVFLIEKG